MKIRFSCKFLKTKTKNDLNKEQEERELADLLGKEYIEEPKYDYEVLTQDHSNICGWNVYDKNHITLRTRIGDIFIVRGDIESFEKRWTEITGEEIHVI